MARELEVYLYQHRVGKLIQDENSDMVFEYAEAWLNTSGAPPLSQSLPLRKERFNRRECRGFFGGILPEGGIRQVTAKILGISAKNDFMMLERIGGECAGAVTFLPPGENLSAQAEDYCALDTQALATLLRDLPRRPLLVGEAGMRLSLAGAQDKVALYVEGEKISLPLGGAMSTHILKPAIDKLEGVVFNELLCMNLAQAVGIPTAHAEVRSCEEIKYLLVERYDRVRVRGTPLQRIHQEDFCQALGIASEQKYQNEGGPYLKDCFRLVREISSHPTRDLLSLLDAVIFNFLIGNNDAHGKNFSLLYEGEWGSKIRLSPCYDLLCTTYYPWLSKNMAMKIGEEYSAERIYPKHFERLAEDVGFGKPMVLRRVRKLATATLTKLHGVMREQVSHIAVTEVICQNCERTLSRF